MTTQLLSYSIISLVFTTLLLGFVLGVIVVSYRKILDRLSQLQQKEAQMKHQVQQESDAILQSAHDKAAKLLSDTNGIREEQAKLQKNLYEQTLGEIKTQTVHLVEEIAGRVKDVVTQDFEASKDTLRKSIFEQYQKDYQQIKNDLDAYKKQATVVIDEKTKMVIKDVALKVFGKTLSSTEHSDLIIKALDEAKKRHVI